MLRWLVWAVKTHFTVTRMGAKGGQCGLILLRIGVFGKDRLVTWTDSGEVQVCQSGSKL